MTEYGRKHTDGSRSGGQPVVDNAMLEALQKDTGIPHLPTQETYEFRLAVGGEGPLAYQWSDKPHRLLYAACRIIESEAALRQPTQSDVLREALESIKQRCETFANINLVGRSMEAKKAGTLRRVYEDAHAALQEQSK